MFKELIEKNRSYRRFDQSHLLDEERLRELIDYARHSASTSNLQPIKHLIYNNQKENKALFSTLGWAGYLKDWKGPEEGERPTAYIVILGDKNISNKFSMHAEIVAQSILLGAVETGLGGCIIGSVKRDKLRKQFKIPVRYDILFVIALGKPAERIILEEVKAGQDIKYWRDKNGVHHVPKRPREEVVLHSFI